MNRRSFLSFLASVPVGVAGVAAAKPIRHPLLLETTIRTIPGPPAPLLPLDTPLLLDTLPVVRWRAIIDKNMFANFPGKPIKWVEVTAGEI